MFNFYSSKIQEIKRSIKNNYPKNQIITSSLYVYFKEEILTNEILEFQVRLTYLFFIVYIKVILSVGIIIKDAIIFLWINYLVHLVQNNC